MGGMLQDDADETDTSPDNTEEDKFRDFWEQTETEHSHFVSYVRACVAARRNLEGHARDMDWYQVFA